MTTTKDTTTELYDAGLDTAIAAIEVAHHASAEDAGAWTLSTPVDFMTTVKQDGVPPPPDESYQQGYEYHALTLRADGWLSFIVKHGEHVDNLLLAPADVHALYRFFSLIAVYRLGRMKAERAEREAGDHAAYIARAARDPDVRERVIREVFAMISRDLDEEGPLSKIAGRTTRR